jgi:hypothetical protein
MEALIIRPRGRCFVRQLAAAAGLGVSAILVALLLAGPRQGELVALMAGFVLLLAAVSHAWWLRQRSPQAIVLTAQYIAVLDPTGKRAYLRWDDVRKANHAATLVGLRWLLHGAKFNLLVRDIGVEPARWAALWHRLSTELESRGAPLRVDLLSYGLYEE